MTATDFLCKSVQDCIDQVKNQLKNETKEVNLAFEYDSDNAASGAFEFVKVQFFHARKADHWSGQVYAEANGTKYTADFVEVRQETIDETNYLVASIPLRDGGEPAFVSTLVSLFTVFKMESLKSEIQAGCQSFMHSYHQNIFN